ncbi:hypothetical protein [Sphingomonas sp.]|uniref:hypothetical protein n=1 Tax=Sphingomonas sp. TaxID=28214 RepID=UPI003CC55123
MFFWDAVVLMVLIGCVTGVIVTFLRRGQHAAPPGDVAALADARDEVRLLRERVQVLERLATDDHGRARLDDEIERLRDR